MLGGPVGDGDGEDAVVVMDLANEVAVRECLADDPWGEEMLVTAGVERWNVLLRRDCA